ncbi:triokinase/FMN cyclase-like isoform X2 [Macrosteles quadrilineatus]|nr:triokinase/FMN cyclase-like isoform X2 [Macrosteles quadrilineatus]
MPRYNHFVITPESCAEDMLRGVAATFPSLTVDDKSRIILYAQGGQSQSRVGLISGGGSGHEPFAAGFVGEGMLTAAVAGKVFTSPPPTTILTTICNVAEMCPGGVLVFIMNYTGDVLNFGLAMERAKLKGIKVRSISVEEDCAIDSPQGAGKRGLCGCLFMFKIAGGMAALGRSLDEIYDECSLIKRHNATFGVTIKPCNMPGSGPMFRIEEGYMELGIGIHGEAGASKCKIAAGDVIAKILVDKLCGTLSIKAGDKVCVIVNNLGGTSQLELFLISGLVHKELGMRNVVVERHYAGILMSSLDMAGIQVSLLLLPSSDERHRQLWLDTLDTHTNAFAWPATSLSLPPLRQTHVFTVDDVETKTQGPQISDQRAEVLRKCLQVSAKALVTNEQKLNELDKGCGDGDTGSTLRRMADAILQNLDQLPVRYPQQCFTLLSKMAEDVMGGTSGALYSLMFVGASKQVPDWTAALGAALSTAMTYSKATLGSRTMFDALIPACEAFKGTSEWTTALHRAVQAAEEGCQRTRHYKPLFGRASYVGADNIKSMDAGAYAVTVWLNAIRRELFCEIMNKTYSEQNPS